MAVTRDERDPGIVLTPEQQRSRRNRNIAIGVAIGLFAALIFVVTLAKLSANMAHPQHGASTMADPT